jgi:hypothetical protein
MFGSTHLREKDSGRGEIEYPQLQEQQSHPREDALPSEHWVKRDYYLGGTGSWTGQQSSSPNNLRVKQSRGENQYPPLINFAGPTTFTQGGSNQGSGSNRNPTYSFQDFVSGGSGIQHPNGGQNRRKSLSIDNDDGDIMNLPQLIMVESRRYCVRAWSIDASGITMKLHSFNLLEGSLVT